MALGSTQTVTEIITSNISWEGEGGGGVKAAGALGLTTLPLS